jgi:signal peptidase I
MRLLSPVTSETEAAKCELAADVLRSHGKLRLQVTGWSMFPAVWPGDTLFVDRVSSSAVSAGDIVLFERDRRLFAHRVLAKGGDGTSAIVTRGDAMPAPDSPVGEDEFLGKVSYIVRNGKCIQPRKTLRVPGRAVAALVQRSEIGARVVVGVYGLLHTSEN